MILPAQLQLLSFQRRLAEQGGALGVRVGTFDALYREILEGSGQTRVTLEETVQKRLIREAASRLELDHYRTVAELPGFIDVVFDLIRELKAGAITPGSFLQALEDAGLGPRLSELGRIYQGYQSWLTRENFVDYPGVGWLAREALVENPRLGADWPLVLVDGFDDFNPVQLGILSDLGERVGELIITLTGEGEGESRELIYNRFNRTRHLLEETFQCRAQPLPVEGEQLERTSGVGPRLAEDLFSSTARGRGSHEGLKMIAAPDRESEVREALRWLKELIVRNDDIEPGDCAVLCRSLEPYRPYLIRTAKEFGLPAAVQGEFPLGENPAGAALINLLRLVEPGDEYLNWRRVVEAWRSPYFDWGKAVPRGDNERPVGIEPGDGETIAWVARWGSVLGGEEQWRETFDLLKGMKIRPGPWDEEYPEVPEMLPIGEQAEVLEGKFLRFLRFLRPPSGTQTLRDFTAWFEDLLGEPEKEDAPAGGLNVFNRVMDASPELAKRDRRALLGIKKALRGLIRAEKVVGSQTISYGRFLRDLEQALETGQAQDTPYAPGKAILAADVVRARGIPFRAAAVLGLAEGEFPATAEEDHFLQDGDRDLLRKRYHLPLRQSTESAEAGYFYEAVSRAEEFLLLTRPRIAENGAPWAASPFWEEVLRRVRVQPVRLTSSTRLPPERCASWGEFFQTASLDEEGGLWSWAESRRPEEAEGIDLGSRILEERTRARSGRIGEYDGGLTAYGGIFSDTYPPDHVWSASRLENYRTCPYYFFTASVLYLEPMEPPREGLDARQLGNLYHRILEELYREVGEDPPLESLLSTLPLVAEKIFTDAPRVEGFRATAWWEETCRTILENLERSLKVIETLDPRFGFYRAEQAFGISRSGGPALVVEGSRGDYFRLRGFIDRVDRSDDGRIRVVDYKTSSPYTFTSYALRDGKKLQLPLYALAAEQALNLGEVAEGFYFHVRHAEPSRLQLASFSMDGEHGPETAMERGAAAAWEAVWGSREGQFVPRAPDQGCPNYCPAAAYCWQYDPVYW